jgi:hypothetical protein
MRLELDKEKESQAHSRALTNAGFLSATSKLETASQCGPIRQERELENCPADLWGGRFYVCLV